MPQSGIAGYVINYPVLSPPKWPARRSFGTGAGPQCLVEDPSNQFFYTANFNDSSVTGQAINQNDGVLTPLSQSSKAPSSMR